VMNWPVGSGGAPDLSSLSAKAGTLRVLRALAKSRARLKPVRHIIFIRP